MARDRGGGGVRTRGARAGECVLDERGPDQGSGGGACSDRTGTGDGKTVELRWDRQTVDETDVSAAP